MAKVGVKDLKQNLTNKTKKELVDEITNLFKTFPAVKEYYQVKLSDTGDGEILEKYKMVIQNEFFPARGYGKLGLSKVKKAISDYKKISPSTEGRLELMVYFVEQGTEFINSYGDIKESFYDSMESTYEDACKLAVKNNWKDEWYDRLHQLTKETQGTGYGFGDVISDLFSEYFE